MSKLPLVQDIVIPILQAKLVPGKAKMVVHWAPDVDNRQWPMIQIRRIGGIRNSQEPTLLGLPVIEMSAFSIDGLDEAEQLYEDTLEVLYDAVRRQTQTAAGYLHSILETQGANPFVSDFQDSWRIQGLIQLGVRPPRST